MRRPPVVLGMAALTGLALIVAVGLILFQVNPQQDTNARNLSSQQRELASQVHDLNEIICSQAQTTANAYRFRSLTPSGKVEPIRHFLTRMQAQRQTLELSQGRKCPVAPGFPPFEFQLKRALEQIERILGSFSAQQREPVDRGISRGTPNPLQISPEFGVPSLINPDKTGKAGIGEEGVPYLPPKGTKHQPPQFLPETPEVTPVEREREPKVAPEPVTPVPPEGFESAPKATEGPPASPPGSALSEAAKKAKKAKEATGNTVEAVLCTAIREVHDLC